MNSLRSTALLLSTLSVVVGPTPAYADLIGVDPGTAQGDGVYGRFDGDFDVGVGVGVRAAAPGFGPNVRVSAHFLSTVGLCVDLTRPVANATGWSLGTAIDLRPLFLPRWALDLEQGPAFMDLLLDSVSISAGPVFHRLGEDDSDVGLGLEAGFAIPLSAHAHGFWLDVRGAGRWLGETSPLGGLVSLSWHTSLLTPLLR